MKRTHIALTVTIALVACPPAMAAPDDVELLKQAQQLFAPLPKDLATPDFPTTKERVTLGRSLFFDTRFSIDGTGRAPVTGAWVVKEGVAWSIDFISSADPQRAVRSYSSDRATTASSSGEIAGLSWRSGRSWKVNGVSSRGSLAVSR